MEKITLQKVLEAYHNARKSRKDKYEVYLFDQNREQRIMDMFSEIKERRYIHSQYKELILNDSKKRYISSPSFRDHILHHVVYSLVYDKLDKKMVYSSFACRKGFGLHIGVLHLQKIIRKEKSSMAEFLDDDKIRKSLYYLKMDFSKYFFSINHEMLKAKIRKHIFDDDILYLIDLIIDSYTSSKIYDFLLGDYSFYIDEKNKGLPIGGILSQLFANFYLNDLDQYIKHTLKISFVRYMDDVLLVGDKSNLIAARKMINEFAETQNLILHPKKVSFHPLSIGVRFAGYMIKDDTIYAGKRIRTSFNKFMDKYDGMDLNSPDLSRDMRQRMESKYFSRTGCFKITDFGNNYINKRGIADFHPRG